MNSEQATTHGGEHRYMASYQKRERHKGLQRLREFPRLSVNLRRCDVSAVVANQGAIYNAQGCGKLICFSTYH